MSHAASVPWCFPGLIRAQLSSLVHLLFWRNGKADNTEKEERKTGALQKEGKWKTRLVFILKIVLLQETFWHANSFNAQGTAVTYSATSGISKFSVNTVFIFRSDFLTTIPFEFCWERKNKQNYTPGVKSLHPKAQVHMLVLRKRKCSPCFLALIFTLCFPPCSWN